MKETLTLADLEGWEPHAGALAVLGDPIEHSLSPLMHNAALAEMRQEALGLAAWRYYRFKTPASELPEALRRLHAAGFVGLNLTIPHKIEAVELVEALDPTAAAMGAVNTLLRTATGWRGMNTDGIGLSTAVKACFGRRLADAPVILLGAGGAARSIAVQCLSEGCPELWIGNRSADRLEALVAHLAESLGGERVRTFRFDAVPAELPSQALLLNATSVGLYPGDALPLDLGRWGAKSALYDTTYGSRNAWADAADAAGIPYANGLAMLVRQGAASLGAWSGVEPPVATMEAALTERATR